MNDVVQKLKLENNVFEKKWSPKKIKIHRFLTSKVDFESMILALFDEPSFIDRYFLSLFFLL